MKNEIKKENSQIPLGAFEKKTFDTIVAENEFKTVVEKCKDFVNKDCREYWFMTLYGSTGTCKTHLAWAMGIEALKTREVIYWQVAEMLDLLQCSQFDMSYMGIINKIKTVDFLILDDFADYKDTDFRTEKMDMLINYRYENYLDTVITTNKNLKELVLFNQRIASRLLGQATLSMTGNDYRIIYKQNNDIFKPTDKPLLRGKYVVKRESEW